MSSKKAVCSFKYMENAGIWCVSIAKSMNYMVMVLAQLPFAENTVEGTKLQFKGVCG